MVTLSLLLSGSAAGTDLAGDVEIDGAPLGTLLNEANIAGGTFLFSPTVPVTWATGTHTIEYFAWHPSGPGTGTAVLAQTAWVRET
jgi:hypothetical protein